MPLHHLALAAIVSCAAVFGSPAAVAADEPYPSRPVRLVVPAAPGGGSDLVARIIAVKLGQVLGQSVFIENRAGAGGAIGASIASRAPADGYTVLVTFASNATNAAVIKKPGYDLERDFAPVSLVAMQPYLLSANPSLRVRDVKGLVALASEKPDDIRFGSGSRGASSDLAMQLLLGTANIKMMNIPYKGVGPALTAVIGGEVQVMMGSLVSGLPQVRGGRLVALGVTSAKRVAAAPTFRRSQNPACPASRLPTGRGCSCPPERRGPSS